MASNMKSFEFRMSKKVAELTQVVHMLFTRNHEKEVELEALKEAYEHEIELILKDARSKIDETQQRVRDAQLQNRAGEERLKAEIQRATSERDGVWQQKMAELEKLVRDEKRESQNSRDLLIKAQQDIQRLRAGQNDDAVRLTRDLNDKSKEVDRLKSLVKNLEHNLSDKQQKLTAIAGLEKTHEAMRKDLEHCKDTLKNNEKLKEQLIARNKSLESEMKIIKRELNKKPQEKPPNTAQSASSSGMLDYGDELERLRREIQRYRNELSNRETNFNRMFADKQAVSLNGERRGSPSKSSKLASPSFENGVAMRIARERSSLDSAFHRERTLELARERTFGASYSPTKSVADMSRDDILENFDVKPRSSDRPREAGPPQNRLPSLSTSNDATARLQKLMKPKPLPKELLSAKH